MYTARLRRPIPYVDKTVYVSWNALCISAYLQAARVLGPPGDPAMSEARSFALRSLDRILSEAWAPERGLLHVIAYSEQGSSTENSTGMRARRIPRGNARSRACSMTTRSPRSPVSRRMKAPPTSAISALANRSPTSWLLTFTTSKTAAFSIWPATAGANAIGALTARRKPFRIRQLRPGIPSPQS